MIEGLDIIKLIIAVLIGYGLVFLLMWLFRRKDLRKEAKPK